MKHLRLAKKNAETNKKSWTDLYDGAIVRKIRARYTINQELAILRQRDEKPEEFGEYNAFVEQCKAEVKKDLEI